MPTKRQVIELLKRNELIEAVRRFEVPVIDRRVRDQTIEALSSARRVRLDDILSGLSVARLKELARELGVEVTGRSKAAFIGGLAAKGRAVVARITKKRGPGRPRKKEAAKKAARPVGRPRKEKAPKAPKPPKVRQLLEALKRNELLGLLDRFELSVPDRRIRASVIAALARRIPILAVLELLSRNRLIELCRLFGLEASGRAKADFIERLSGESAPPPAAPKKKAAPAKKKAAPAKKKAAPAKKKAAPAKKKAAPAKKKAAPKKEAAPVKKKAAPAKKKAAPAKNKAVVEKEAVVEKKAAEPEESPAKKPPKKRRAKRKVAAKPAKEKPEPAEKPEEAPVAEKPVEAVEQAEAVTPPQPESAEPAPAESAAQSEPEESAPEAGAPEGGAKESEG